jgi:hypothetical protein
VEELEEVERDGVEAVAYAAAASTTDGDHQISTARNPIESEEEIQEQKNASLTVVGWLLVAIGASLLVVVDSEAIAAPRGIETR